MFKKIVLVCVLAFIAIQIGDVSARSIKSIQPIPLRKVAPRGLLDDANTLLNELESKSSAALESGKKQLDEYRTRIQSINVQITTAGQNLINSLAKESVSELDTIIVTASKVNADINLCLSTNEDAIRELGAQTTNQLNACLNRRYTNANDDLDDTSRELDNTYRRVNEARKALGQCGDSNEKCIQDAIELIKNEIIQIPGWINQEVQLAAQSLDHSASLLGDCVTTSEFEIKDTSADLLQEVQGCSKDIVAFFTKYIISNTVQLRTA